MQGASRLRRCDASSTIIGSERIPELVYASVGAIEWTTFMPRWMRIAAALLRPGAREYLRDVHHGRGDRSGGDGPGAALPYSETAEPVTTQAETTYAGDRTKLTYRTTHERSHGIGEVEQGTIHGACRHESARAFLPGLAAYPSMRWSPESRSRQARAAAATMPAWRSC